MHEVGGLVVTRTLAISHQSACTACSILQTSRTDRAPITPLRTVSGETVGEGGGMLLGKATGALFPTFWRFVSDAILMRASKQTRSRKTVAAFAEQERSEEVVERMTWEGMAVLGMSEDGRGFRKACTRTNLTKGLHDSKLTPALR